MKNLKFFSAEMVMLTLMLMGFLPVKTVAQEQQESNFSVNADVYSNYIWRGSKLGTGPAFQPSVKFSGGGLTVGVWGSFDANGYSEADPYISYSFPFGLSLGLTDYYLPGLSFFETSKETGSHAFEFNAGFTKGRISLGANYIFNEAGGIASAGGDKYFQIGYSFSNVSLIAGAGDGWHTSDGEFNLSNLGIGASKILQITEKFALPLTGQIILNPDKEVFYVVAGISF
jgi:hypothetical protein